MLRRMLHVVLNLHCIGECKNKLATGQWDINGTIGITLGYIFNRFTSIVPLSRSSCDLQQSTKTRHLSLEEVGSAKIYLSVCVCVCVCACVSLCERDNRDKGTIA